MSFYYLISGVDELQKFAQRQAEISPHLVDCWAQIQYYPPDYATSEPCGSILLKFFSEADLILFKLKFS